VSNLGRLSHHVQVILEANSMNLNGLINRSLLFLKHIMKPRASTSNLKWDKSPPVQSNPIPSNDKTVDSVQRDHDDRGDSVVFNDNDNDDLRSTQYGTHDEHQDDGEVNSRERSLVQDNPRKR